MGLPGLPVLRVLPRIKGLILDVDGVLTDGSLLYGDGSQEMKSFHVRDGHGLVLLIRTGFPVGIISGRRGHATERRFSELGITDVFLGIRNKRDAFDELLGRWNFAPEEVAVMGDDTTDMAILHSCGLSITVSDAHPRLLRTVDWIVSSPGGRGAVRQVADALLFIRNRGKAGTAEDTLC